MEDIINYINPNRLSVEDILTELLDKYRNCRPIEVFKFFNYSVIKLNVEKGYARDISLKLLLNFFYIYSKNVSYGDELINFKEEYIFLKQKIHQLYQVYISIALNDIDKNSDLLFDNITYQAFITYNFDYPTITLRQYKEFLKMNKVIINSIYKDKGLNYLNILKGLHILLNLEVYQNKTLNKKIEGKYLIILEEVASNILSKHDVPAKKFIYCFFEEINETDQINIIYPTDVYKTFRGKLGIKFDNYLFLPINYFIYDNIFSFVTQSEEFKSIKGDLTEEYCYDILCDLFEENNVYCNLFDKDKKEQDIIVTYNEKILVFECKSNKLREPFREYKKADKRLRSDFSSSIEKAYNQAYRVREAVKKNNAIYYDSDNDKKRNLVLNLNDYKYENVIMVSVTFETYLNLATNLHLLLKINKEDGVYPWAIDIFSLEHIINKCIKEFDPNYFIEYINNRVKIYGSTTASSADEVSLFGYYLKYGENLFELGSAFSVAVGSGYSSFVIDEYTENGIANEHY